MKTSSKDAGMNFIVEGILCQNLAGLLQINADPTGMSLVPDS